MYGDSALDIRNSFLKGDVSAKSITSYFLSRIEKYDDKISSMISVFNDRAMQKADILDKKKDEGKPIGKLAAVPVILKDAIHVKGEKTTCGSRFLEEYISPFDATVTKLIEDAGAIILGKSNLDEFAMGSSTENSAFKVTKNPWDTNRSPGGSSGGSAATVSAMFAPISLGSDTGGSIRQPSSMCGVSGFKPSYGMVSRYGLFPFGSSFDQIGPIARSAEEIALMQEVLAVHCCNDSTSIAEKTPENYLKKINLPIEGKVIGIPRSNIDTETPLLDSALDTFNSLGVKIVDVKLDLLKFAIAVYYVLSTAEASTNLACFDGVRYGQRAKSAKSIADLYLLSKNESFGKEVKQRILMGTYILSSKHKKEFFSKAQKIRSLIIEEYQRAFDKCDVICLPTSPGPAFEIGSIADPLSMYKQDLYTTSANIAGIPAISIPIGLHNGMPIGMQIQSRLLDDAMVLNFAHQYQCHNDYLKPPLFDKE